MFIIKLPRLHLLMLPNKQGNVKFTFAQKVREILSFNLYVNVLT